MNSQSDKSLRGAKTGLRIKGIKSIQFSVESVEIESTPLLTTIVVMLSVVTVAGFSQFWR
jgi:hypothetical protein